MLKWALFIAAGIIVPAIIAIIGSFIEKISINEDFPTLYFVLSAVFSVLGFCAGLFMLLS